MLTYILFLLGFVLLIKGADLLVDGSASLANHFYVSPLVIGLTVVSFGTSAPELFVNVVASFEGNPDIAIGNVLGSNIANILLILGVSAAIYPMVVQRSTVYKELPYSVLAVLILAFMANDRLLDGASGSILTRTDGLVLIAFFSIFMYYAFEMGLKKAEKEVIPALPKWRSVLYVVLGVVGLAFGADWIVKGAVEIAEAAGVSQSFIALTIISIGTSLPELATTVAAAVKRNADIAIGNVVGSNIFNILWVLGCSAIIKPIPFNIKSNYDIGMTLVATFLLFAFIFMGRKHFLHRWQGILFVALYGAYIVGLFWLEGNPWE